jgi:hypothetical protein
MIYKKKNNTKKKKIGYLLAPETISPRFCGAKSALRHNFAGQRTKAL